MQNYTTLAIRLDDLEAARAHVENLLGIELEGHNSEAWGDYYITPNDKMDGGEISVWENALFDEDGQFWAEEKFKEYPLLISINGVPTLARLDAMIGTILSESNFKAVLVSKTFYDGKGNKFDKDGNLIEEAD